MQQFFRLTGVDRNMMAGRYAGKPEACRNAIHLTNLSRVFLAILLLKCAVLLLSGTYIMDAWAKLFTIPLLFICICLLMFTCHLLESGRSTAGKLMLTSVISISCMVSVIFCGGFINSQFTPILLFPIILAFCTLRTIHSSAMIGAIVLVPLGVDLVARHTGVILPDFTSANDPMITQINLMATLFACVFFCLFYLNQSHKASNEAGSGKKSAG